MMFGKKKFSKWIYQADTQDSSDDSSSIPSEAAVLDDLHAKGNGDTQTTVAVVEGRVHENLYDAERQSGAKLKDSLVLMGDRIGDRMGERLESARETIRENCQLFLLVSAAIVLIVVGMIVVGVNVGRSKEKLAVAVPDDDGFDFRGFVNTTSAILPGAPTNAPSKMQSIQDTKMPSAMPSTSEPSISNALPVSLSNFPSLAPIGSWSMSPSSIPGSTELPSFSPTHIPTTPIDPVTRSPVRPFAANDDSVLTFCVIADVPYTEDEVADLPKQIRTQMHGCEFLVHLGDIFVGDTFCRAENYETIRDIMLESHAPAFLVPGDNEWNDCIRSEIDTGWDHWTNHFIGFENNWNHTFSLIRQPGYPENFYFIRKRTLVFGLNIVGGRVHNETEWQIRLRSEYEWVRDVMLLNLVAMDASDGVILMAHANPSEDHSEFFNAFRVFLRDVLKNQFPVLYLHGDGHDFMYTPNYHNQENFLRIQHEGGTNEPVLKIMAGPKRGHRVRSSVQNAFQYNRQLSTFPSREKEKNKKDE
ncbi:unnamed protein product [Pseudo-nitzschia multistriata]|uniref:Calcineurin-like phosphoesterase domain-containing protein n=1 Tax=Pseudo-nitzschia multistriata TaxID=183589 RepID=A0A448ZTE2_9STRA|nr:unnamed protein product [Pseudo-nitzschia multistriata]